MVYRPRTPKRRLLLLLWIALSSCAGFCLAYHHSHPQTPAQRHQLSPPAVFSEVINNVTSSLSAARLRHQCPRSKRTHPPLSELQAMIERTVPHRQPGYPRSNAALPVSLAPKREPTCLPAPSRCQAGDPCAPGGLCAPDLPQARLQRARRLYLEHCPHLNLFTVMSNKDRTDLSDTTLCCALGRHLMERDKLVHDFLLQQDSLLDRNNFDDKCGTDKGVLTANRKCGGSTNGPCITCQEAYRRWVCSQLFVFYDGTGCPVKPCSSICHCVEQTCPYLLPQDKPVAGEPSFLCEDPSIGLSGEKAAHDSRCYEPCPYDMSLGPLHENISVSGIAVCLCNKDQDSAGRRDKWGMLKKSKKSQCLSAPCLSSASYSSIRIAAHRGVWILCWWTHKQSYVLLFSVMLSFLLQLPNGFT